MDVNAKRTTADKLRIYRSLFTGRTDVYGTYDPSSGRSFQVKKPVTDAVLLAHLKGRKPYGVYLLVKDRTSAAAVDFDTQDQGLPVDFVSRAKHYRLNACVEVSKSKGYHVWIFFAEPVQALKARLVVGHILHEIEASHIEIFPKQDWLDRNNRYGNFINAPLFGSLVPQEKTVFVEPVTFEPYPNQWDFLESVVRHEESALDEIIEINDLKTSRQPNSSAAQVTSHNGHTLPICIRKMLETGVTEYQRVSCFRLAVHFKRIGLPYEIAVPVLKLWRKKNQPRNGKRLITDAEIISQASDAYTKDYRGYGCDSEAMAVFCSPDCPLKRDGTVQ
ncbi:MAG: hypothetical protein SWQ30_12805 [Thermodesulfobacteriota bacterium]|nr:hypothetical protein [Thermodesulfobacteriota bacterium]